MFVLSKYNAYYSNFGHFFLYCKSLHVALQRSIIVETQPKKARQPERCLAFLLFRYEMLDIRY